MATSYHSHRRGTKRPAPQPEDDTLNEDDQMRCALKSLQEHIDRIVEQTITTAKLDKESYKTPESMGWEQGQWHIARIGGNALQLVVNPVKYPGFVYFGHSGEGLNTSPLKRIIELNPDSIEERDHVFLFITTRSMYAVPAKHQRWVDKQLRTEIIRNGYATFGVEYDCWRE